jgi:cobalt/nickel transport system permease protein
MAVVGSFVSYAVYALGQRLLPKKRWSTYTSGFLAAWFSIVIASLIVALQLALSGTTSAALAVPTMGGIHVLIGLGEGLITLGALAFIGATRPDLVEGGAIEQGGVQRGVVLGGLVIALALAVISPLASGNPDGLEWAAEQLRFLDTAREPAYNIIPDYVMPGISNEALATVVAGIIGTVIVFGVVVASGRFGSGESTS